MAQRRRRYPETLEGRHGPKTHRELIDQLQSGASGADGGVGRPRGSRGEHPREPGRARLVEGREQHDEADKNSESNRLHKDLGRGRRVAGVDAPLDTPESPKT